MTSTSDPSPPLDVEAIIGPEGRIARRLDRYQHRPQQLEMAKAVADAFKNQQHLVAEAGTGTGKSFAYLVPAVLFATADQKETEATPDPPASKDKNAATDKTKQQRKVIISTHTIALQEQLVLKDIPLLNSVIPREFSAVLVKGRNNYVSIRRLENAIAKATSLFANDIQYQQLRTLRQWAQSTNDGSRATLPIIPDASVWDEIQSDSSNCLGRKCPHHGDCHYYRARRRAAHAQVLIVNHALFFSDLAIRAEGGGFLPNYDAVVFDESHTIEAVASEHMGLRLSNTQIEYALNKLYNDKTHKGLLEVHDLRSLQSDVFRCHSAVSGYFADLLDWFDHSGKENGRVPEARIVENYLSEPFNELAGKLKLTAAKQKNESIAKDFSSAAERLETIAGTIVQWNDQRLEDSVYWIERSKTRRGFERVTLAASPVHIGHTLATELFAKVKSVILTSATLAVGKQQNFDFFCSRIGLTGNQSLQVGSPFDYRRQAKLVVMPRMPDPSLHRNEFEKAILDPIRRHVTETKGHAFVLFTSYDLLRRTANALMPWLVKEQLELYAQGGDLTRTQLLDAFKQNPQGVLFGTDSFWQGVDVPGDALQNVIITKLPFSVPDHPLLEARLDHIRSSGGNPFRDYQLPEAVIKLRQGFGRLIRTEHDFGKVVILDPRVTTKPYGRIFLESLPDCEIVYET